MSHSQWPGQPTVMAHRWLAVWPWGTGSYHLPPLRPHPDSNYLGPDATQLCTLSAGWPWAAHCTSLSFTLLSWSLL